MAVNQQVLEGHWNEIKGKLRERWGSLSNDDLQRARGSVDELVGVIQRKSGAAREKIMGFLEELTAGGGSAAGAAREFAQGAAERAQEVSQQAAETLRAGYERTEEMVRERPVESLAVCFAAGLITGVLVALVMRPR